AAAPDPSQPSRLYFVPNGDFAMTAPGAALPDHRLLCGFAATEDLSFSDGDVLRFTPSTEAEIAATGTGNGGDTFAPAPDAGFGTAWAMVVKTVTPPLPQPQLSTYRSECARSPLFSPPASTPLSMLRHDGFAMCALPNPPPADAAFP